MLLVELSNNKWSSTQNEGDLEFLFEDVNV